MAKQLAKRGAASQSFVLQWIPEAGPLARSPLDTVSGDFSFELVQVESGGGLAPATGGGCGGGRGRLLGAIRAHLAIDPPATAVRAPPTRGARDTLSRVC